VKNWKKRTLRRSVLRTKTRLATTSEKVKLNRVVKGVGEKELGNYSGTPNT